jgi:hypothetical protein
MTYTPIGKLTTFQYIISVIGRFGWNQFNIGTVLPTPKLMTTWTCRKAGPPGMAPRRRKSMPDSRKQLTISIKRLRQIRGEGILMFLYVDEIFTMYLCTEAATIAAIEINTKLRNDG